MGIEDDQRLARRIKGELEDNHLQVDVAYDGGTGVDVAPCLPAAVLLLPARGQRAERVGALDSGADDDLTKPFTFEEVLARVHTLGRRFLIVGDDRAALRVGAVVLDPRPRVAHRREQVLDLPATAWNLLDGLLWHPDQGRRAGPCAYNSVSRATGRPASSV